jgi:(p)ppGpp synthase/HD superfamily hydrolase
MNLELRAKEFATLKHAEVGRVRKYTGEPYIVHPAAVVEIVRGVPHTKEMLAAAWLHDTVNDTNTSIDEIERLFGLKVAELVEMVTDVSKPSDGNRAARKAIDRAHDALASPEGKTIRLADMIDNLGSIFERDKKFGMTYAKEKHLLLEVLTEGDQSLWLRARSMVDSDFLHNGIVT